MQQPRDDQGRTIAIIAYLSILGLIIAFIMNKEKNSQFASFHIRQSLGLIILFIVAWIGFSILNMLISIPVLALIVYLGLFVLWILGFINAVQNEVKSIPFFGDHFQEWFKGIG